MVSALRGGGDPAAARALFAVKPTLGAIVWAYRPSAMAVGGEPGARGGEPCRLPSVARGVERRAPRGPNLSCALQSAGRLGAALGGAPLAPTRGPAPARDRLHPPTIVLNEGLPLFLAVRTRREAGVFVCLTLAAAYFELMRAWPPEPLDDYLVRCGQRSCCCCMCPCSSWCSGGRTWRSTQCGSGEPTTQEGPTACRRRAPCSPDSSTGCGATRRSATGKAPSASSRAQSLGPGSRRSAGAGARTIRPVSHSTRS